MYYAGQGDKRFFENLGSFKVWKNAPLNFFKAFFQGIDCMQFSLTVITRCKKRGDIDTGYFSKFLKGLQPVQFFLLGSF
jgi:hypothetical protein